jgi:hypothetical protein
MIEAADDRPAETVLALILNRPQGRVCFLQVGQDAPRGICAAIVDDYDLVRNVLKPQFKMEVFDGGSNAPGLVPGGNYDRQQLQRSTGGIF